METQFKLHWHAKRSLEQLLTQTHDATTLRRAQALLWLDRGESVAQVAARLGMSRQAIYKWIDMFERDIALETVTRLEVRPRSGRPRTVAGIIDVLLDEVIDHDPRTYGYNSTVWTARLLAAYLQEQHDVVASVPSVRLALARLGLRWKRPRYALALRAPTWRQAKGGLKRGSLANPARLC